MIISTDEFKKVVNQLENGKYIMIGTDDKYGDDVAIEKVVKKSSHRDNPYVWHYVICSVIGR